MPTKVCNKCKVEKPLSEFHTDRNLSTGVRGICKVCGLGYVKERYHTDTEYKNKVNGLSRSYYWARKERDPNYRRIPDNLKAKKVKVRTVRPEKANSFKRPSVVCQIITEHHNLLKDDPNRLTTEFIQMLVGVECGVV